MSFCKLCITGALHEGTPTGKVEEINGVKTYVALPESDYPKDKALLLPPDVFGFEAVNTRLLADGFAKNGFQVYVPDFLEGDPLPNDAFESGTFDLQAWFSRHGVDKTRPLLDKVIAGLKEKDVTEFGASGYCFSARHVFDLAFDGVLKVAAVSHPSQIEAPKDLEKFKETGIPLLVNSCETDPMYPAEKQKAGDDILGGGKTEAPGYKRTYWPGCSHGFAIRGDVSDPFVKTGREGAFKATVEWFLERL